MTKSTHVKKMPGFNHSEAKTKEEKLIVELNNNLGDTAKVFINLNINNTSINEMFVILRDATLSHTANQLESLTKMMKDKKQIPLFLEECHQIFKAYLNKMEKDHA